MKNRIDKSDFSTSLVLFYVFVLLQASHSNAHSRTHSKSVTHDSLLNRAMPEPNRTTVNIRYHAANAGGFYLFLHSCFCMRRSIAATRTHRHTSHHTSEYTHYIDFGTFSLSISFSFAHSVNFLYWFDLCFCCCSLALRTGKQFFRFCLLEKYHPMRRVCLTTTTTISMVMAKWRYCVWRMLFDNLPFLLLSPSLSRCGWFHIYQPASHFCTVIKLYCVCVVYLSVSCVCIQTHENFLFNVPSTVPCSLGYHSFLRRKRLSKRKNASTQVVTTAKINTVKQLHISSPQRPTKN